MADFEAGSIFIAFRSATDALARGFAKARSLFRRLGGVAQAFAKVMRRAATRVGTAFQKMGRTLSRAMLAVKIAIGVATIAAIKWASEGVEATNKMNVVFGEHANIVADFAKTSALAFGIASKDAKGYAATLGQILLVSGETQESAAKMSVEILKLAADMASFDEVSIDDALTKIRSGLVGEVEPLRRVGILLSEAAVQAKALELGLVANKNELTDQIKVQVRFALIMEQSAQRIGDFTRTSKEFANSLRIVRAQIINIVEQLGAFLLPILTKGLQKVKAILAIIPVIIEEIGGLDTVGQKVAGGAAATLQAFISTATTLLTATVQTVFTFLSKSADKLIKLMFKAVVSIAGPSAIKIGKSVLANIKTTTLQAIILLSEPIQIVIELAKNGLRVIDASFNRFVAGVQDGIADVLDVIPEWMLPEGEADLFRRSAQQWRDAAAVIEQDILTFDELVEKVGSKTSRMFESVEADAVDAAERLRTEIDSIETGLLESGVLKDVTDEAVRLLKSGVDIASTNFRSAMQDIAERYGIDIDVIIARIKAAKLEVAAAPPEVAPGKKTDVGTGIQAIDPKVQKEIDDLAKATSDSISSAVAGGITDGVLEGKGALSILADVGRRLFKNAFTAAVNSFQKALDTAIAASGIKAKAVMSGVLNAAIAIVGLLLSQLDKASDSSRRFGKIGAEVESSQLVRGVVAGPSNVAIAEVGENLKRALATTEQILRDSLFVQIETRDRLGGRGNGIQAVGTAGSVPGVSP